MNVLGIPLVQDAEVNRALRVLVEPGQVFEVRILNALKPGFRRPFTVSGYFSDPDLVPAALRELRLDSAKGFYVTLNPVDPALLARSHNRLSVSQGGELTADGNIRRRRWLLVDFDPERPHSVSATDAEKVAARDRALAVREMLRSVGWPEPGLGDSGNGYHLLYRIDLSVESDLVKRVLETLALRFDDAAVKIDRVVFNPSRIVKLYGTVTQKGDHCPDLGRVHRMSALLEVPDPLVPVPEEALAALAGPAQEELPARGSRRRIAWGQGGAWDRERMQAFVDANLAACDPGPPVAYDGGWKWVLGVCPFNPAHTNRSALVVLRANGALGFRCLHNGCRDFHWKDLRGKFEPKTVRPSRPVCVEKPAATEARVSAGNGYGPFLIGEDGDLAINQMPFADRYVKESGTIYDPAVKRFFTYAPPTGLWQHRTDEATMRELGVTFQRIVEEEQQPDILAKRTAHVLRGLCDMARGMAERRNVFNQRRDVIHVANGMLVIGVDGSVELKPFGPEWYSRNRSEIAWNPAAECPRFKQELLLSAMDEDDASLIQRYVGQCLLGMNLSQTILVARGTPGGGKSTLANVVEGVIGRFNVTELRIAQLSERFELVRYIGRTLLTGKDVPGDFLNMRPAYVLKALVGGDTLEGEVKHGNESFSIDGRFNVIISTNTRLRVKLDADAGAWRRRLLIVDYSRPKPARPVPNFDQLLLREEGEGILRWAVEGAVKVVQELRETGRFQLTAVQQRRVDDLLSESDSVRSFVRDGVEQRHGAEVAIHELTAAYRDYCESRDWDPLRERQFQSELPDAMLEFHRAPRRNDVRRDGKNVRGFRGVCLRGAGGVPAATPGIIPGTNLSVASAPPLLIPLGRVAETGASCEGSPFADLPAKDAVLPAQSSDAVQDDEDARPDAWLDDA